MTELGLGEYVAGENHYLVQRRRGPGDAQKPPLIFCHQHQASAVAVAAATYYQTLLRALAEDFTVVACDLGWTGSGCDVWGNPTHVARIGQARTFLSGRGSTGNVTLVATSMGNLGAMNYAKANPSVVAALAGIVPALSLASLKTVNSGAYAACIDSAYGGTYSDASNGPTSSPYVYRASYPIAQVPTAIWTTPDDAICLPAWSTSFAAATGCKNYSLVDGNGDGYGHTETAIAAAVPGVIAWVRGARTLG